LFVWDEHPLSPAVAALLARDEREREEREQREWQERQTKPPAPKRQGVLRKIYRERGAWVYDTEQSGPRMIRGIASSSLINSNNRSLKSSGCRAKFPVPLLCSHESLGQIGDVVLLQVEQNRVVIEGMFWNTDAARYAWDKLILSGEMRFLSVGSVSIHKTIVDGITFFDSWLLREVSIVRKPANPDCVFEVMNDAHEHRG
jgi:hypothetical protein